jgi:hypothetical protein
MNLYTILISFEDRTVGIDQFEAETPQKALEEFINKAESLEEYDRKKIFSLIINRSRQGNLLMHIAKNLKGFWIIDLGTDFSDIPELSSIYGGYIVQTDLMAPKRTN